MDDMVIGEGTEITLHFSLQLEDGELVDSNFDTQPATFNYGDGNLLSGFEEALVGMQAGQKQRFFIPRRKVLANPILTISRWSSATVLIRRLSWPRAW